MPSNVLKWDREKQLYINMSTSTPTSEIFCDFEDIHLEGNADYRYRIRHNPNISNFQYTVIESKTDTLGGKYPFIRRNGDTYYRQFPISGLITHFDEEDSPEEYQAKNIKNFASNSAIAGEEENNDIIEDYFNRRIRKWVADSNDDLKQKFDNHYYSQSNVNGYTDYLLEKEYREDVYDFLYKNRVRLFRSPTEGNILVKLMNISFTPNQQIDRRVFSMQCTAYEVDDFSVEKCIEYGIWDNNKDILPNMTLKGHPYVFIGQLRHNDTPDLTQEGPFIHVDFYQEILDAAKQVQGVLNVEKVIWLKTEYEGAASYFGKDEAERISWAALPNSPIISELRLNTAENSTSDDDLPVDIRIYDSVYPSAELATAFFEQESSSEAYQGALYGYVQKLAFLVVNYIWGDCYQHDGITGSWDDINDWPVELRTAFENELKEGVTIEGSTEKVSVLAINDNLYAKDFDDNYVLKNALAWTLQNIIDVYRTTEGTIGSASGQYILSRAADSSAGSLKDDALFEKVKDVFNTITISAAQAILSMSVELLMKPFNGYWIEEDGTLHPVEEEKSIRSVNGYFYGNTAKPFIDFWISLALTMTFYGKWGFGTSDNQNLREKTLKDKIGDKAILIDAGLTSNSLSSLTLTDILLAGYGMYVNHELVIIPPQGHYELTDQDTEITQLSYQRLKDEPLNCLIDYAALCRVYTMEDLLSSRKTVALYYKLGQLRDIESGFENDLITQIKMRYEQDIKEDDFTNATKRTVVSVPYVSIEAMPYTRVFMQDSLDEVEQEHIINDNGILTFYDKNTNIKKLHFMTYGDNEHQIVEDRNEILYDDEKAMGDVLVNYICLIMETRY